MTSSDQSNRTAAALLIALVAIAPMLAVPVSLGVLAMMLGAGSSPNPTTARQLAHVPGIPKIVLGAYLRAATAATRAAPNCNGMRWSILAGIGKIESDHLRGRTITPSGDVRPPFYGPRLDGSGVGGNITPFHDTDHGRWDGDTVYDRSVGLMQFIPSTWASGGYSGPQGDGRDGNADGIADPNNVYDSALAAVVHLCGAGHVNLTHRGQLSKAIYRYNHSSTYVRNVLSRIDHYDKITPRAVADSAGLALPPASGVAARVLAFARAQLGKPYVWGAEGPGAFDCSGLVMKAYRAAGISIPRVTFDQWPKGTRVPRGHEQPGDLVFFSSGPNAGAGRPGHVGIVIGRGKMINARCTACRPGIAIDPYHRPSLMGFRRYGKR